MLDDYANRMESAISGRILDVRHELEKLELQLQSLDIHRVLERGFSVTTLKGKPVKEAAKLKVGERIETMYNKGKTTSTIDEIK